MIISVEFLCFVNMPSSSPPFPPPLSASHSLSSFSVMSAPSLIHCSPSPLHISLSTPIHLSPRSWEGSIVEGWLIICGGTTSGQFLIRQEGLTWWSGWYFWQMDQELEIWSIPSFLLFSWRKRDWGYEWKERGFGGRLKWEKLPCFIFFLLFELLYFDFHNFILSVNSGILPQ